MGQKIHLTKDQVDEIYKLFISKAVKDSDFPTTDSISAGDEITILQNALNKRITYSVILQAILDRVAQGIGGKGLSTEDFTTELKNKLIGIESGAEVNILEGVKVNGIDLVIDNNKKVNVLVPDVSQFITNSVDNLLNYYKKSETYTKAEVATQIANALTGAFVSVDTLPRASGHTMGKIYLVPSSDPSTGNFKDEYITIASASIGEPLYTWEKIGTTAVSLDGVVKFDESQSLTDAQQTQARANIGAGTYSKPSNGIPASDLVSAVQTSLGKADSSVQPVAIVWSNELALSVSQITAALAARDTDTIILKGAYLITLLDDSGCTGDGVRGLLVTSVFDNTEGYDIFAFGVDGGGDIVSVEMHTESDGTITSATCQKTSAQVDEASNAEIDALFV